MPCLRRKLPTVEPVHVDQLREFIVLCDAYKTVAELAAITDHLELQVLRNNLECQLLETAGDLNATFD